MRELAEMVSAGHRAVVFFLVSRADAQAMRPAHEIDSEYATALEQAIKAGVEVLAYKLDFGENTVTIGTPVQVLL